MSNTIDTILTIEYGKLQRTILRLTEECKQRPRGSLAIKHRGRNNYIYLVKRENGKVVTEYIGKEGSWQVKGIEAKIIERRRYEHELDLAENELKKVKKIMKASGVFFVEPRRKVL
jgi:hypothetical protein